MNSKISSLRRIDFYGPNDIRYYAFVKPSKAKRPRNNIIHTWPANGPVGKCDKCPFVTTSTPGRVEKLGEEYDQKFQFETYVRHMKVHDVRIPGV